MNYSFHNSTIATNEQLPHPVEPCGNLLLPGGGSELPHRWGATPDEWQLIIDDVVFTDEGDSLLDSLEASGIF